MKSVQSLRERHDSPPDGIRILHVITRMVKGGAQENTLATVTGIHGDRWRSSLATGPALGPEGSLEPECLSAGVRLLSVPGLVRELSPRQDAAALQQLITLFRKERPHIVHTHTSKAGILGRMAARHTKAPIVVHTPHGHVFHSYEGRLKTRLFVHLERFGARAADRLVALTETERNEHVEIGIGRREQWTTIHSGVDFAPFEACRGTRHAVRRELHLPDDAVVMGTVGRLVPVKGQSYLVDALDRLSAQHHALHLLLVGDGPLRAELIAQSRSLGLNVVIHPNRRPDPHAPGAATVHFMGLRHDVARLMAAMDLFVLPSLNEGMGRVLVEAMAMELPCIASRVSGIPDVVEAGVTGILVPPQDPQALADAMLALLAHPDWMREMGRRGRQKAVPGFSRERMVAQVESLYKELLAEKGIVAA
jgi:glycosyltransferase involved in cell wall biosynthesis